MIEITCAECDARSTVDLVDSREIARRTGLARSTVDQWRQRNVNFPTPELRLAGGPVWRWSSVVGWLATRPRSGRPRLEEPR